MHVKELKAQVEDDAYVVEPRLVAEALLRRAAVLRAQASPVSRRGARGPAGPCLAPRPRG
jgi:hypothetical protein